MDFSRRELVLLSRPSFAKQEDYENEVRELHRILQKAERWEYFCAVHEIIDINRYKIIRKPYQIQQILQEKPIRPFVFLINKN
ncbi:MAG: hypothetical protein ACK5B4_00705 [Bacteroidota bacterium]|jgi:hypothetical protein